ncbi:MAG: DUF3784 domain-containing protein [Flavobacterium sp.]
MEPFIVIGLIYVGLSYFLTPDNADSLLAGYNTMSDTRKKLYDIPSTVKLLNLTMRWTGVCIGLMGIVAILCEWHIVAHIILICGSIIPLIIADVYNRLKFSTDPMRWYNWLMSVSMIIGSIVLTYYTL